MAENKEATSSTPLNQQVDPEDPVKSPPSSPNSSTRKAFYAVLQSWVSKKFMTGCVVLFPVAITFLITWWFIQFVDGFFSPLYARLGINIFGLGFVTSLFFIFCIGLFASSWMGANVFLIGEWFIKRMPFVKHIYSASKQISSAISPDQNTTAFKEVAIIRHPRVGEYAFGFITSSVILQRNDGHEELCSVYVPTNHLYIGDIFLVNSEEIIRPNLSIREGIGQKRGVWVEVAPDRNRGMQVEAARVRKQLIDRIHVEAQSLPASHHPKHYLYAFLRTQPRSSWQFEWTITYSLLKSV